MPFTKFPSIESFGHVWRNKYAMLNGPIVQYGAKIKLHGTNAAIRVENGKAFAQKRTADITPHDDNAGFAAWFELRKHVWSLPEKYFPEVVTYFGEWAGPGVQRGDAVAQLGNKFFFVFAVQINDDVYTDPMTIQKMIPRDCPEMDNVMVLPWETRNTIDFSDNEAADRLAEGMTSMAEQAGERDPFIYSTFGVEGPGEGYVWMPVTTGFEDFVSREVFSSFTFKVKAARHGAKKAKAASRKVEIPNGAKEFVEMFVTEARCQQALVEACGGAAEKPLTADFLKWIGGDIKKESEVELADAGLEWKQVSKLVNSVAVQWFHEKCNHPFSAAA